jgi:hypothetical protein
MPSISFRITKNYFFEADILRKIRSFKDGISFLEFEFNLDLYRGDHNPKGRIMLVIFNWKIFEFEIYNINHVDWE